MVFNLKGYTCSICYDEASFVLEDERTGQTMAGCPEHKTQILTIWAGSDYQELEPIPDPLGELREMENSQ